MTKPFFYHMYALGFCGCPEINPIALPKPNLYQIQPVNRLAKLRNYYHHFKQLGITHLYTGPIFEACTHGYDTINYFSIDRRLGSNELFAEIVAELQAQNIKVIVDLCLNHTSRLFPAFLDIKKNGRQSKFVDWYQEIDFTKNTPWNDGFSYKSWRGQSELPVLNHANPEVQKYLYRVAQFWLEKYHIDGWRLDVAFEFPPDFWQQFRKLTESISPHTYLLGELVEQDYSSYVQPDILDAATNYQLYENSWQAYNSQNFYQLNNSLLEQQTRYQNDSLLNFSSSHDTNRLYSQLYDPNHINQFFTVLFCLPGIPCLYYGDELNLIGFKDKKSANIRQPMPLPKLFLPEQKQQINFLTRLAHIYQKLKPVSHHNLKIVAVHHQYFIFQLPADKLTVITNNYFHPATVNAPQTLQNRHYRNLLDDRPVEIERSLFLYPNRPLLLKSA